MVDHIFRQYDIRGKIGSELMIEDIPAIAKAIALYFVDKKPATKRIAVGADGRTHSPVIKELLCAALQESGLDVVFIGICPTPVLYFALFNLSVDAGLMITASHNGKEYNGIKICLGRDSVWGKEIQQIKHLAYKGAARQSDAMGSYTYHELIPTYIAWLVDNFAHLKNMEIPLVMDCGNGAAGTVVPALIKAMNWKYVRVLYPEVDGTYPHHEADPTVEKNMSDVKHMLSNTDLLFGIGYDGDCDRMACMTKKGELVQGDKLLALFSKDIIKHNPGATIVFDVKCSSGLIELLNAWGAKPFMSASGHSIIKNEMKKNKALLAGELSCHFFFGDRYFGYDDGIYAALRLIELLIGSGKNLEELLEVFPVKMNTPEIRMSCKEEDKQRIVAHVKSVFLSNPVAHVNDIDGIRVALPYGWGILRASNTQSALTLRFESDTLAGLKRIEQDFMLQLKPYFTEQLLKEHFGAD